MDLLEGQPDLPGTGGLEIAGAQALDDVALARREVGGVLEAGMAGSLQLRPSLLFIAAALVGGIVDDPHGMELVKGDRGLRQVLGGALDERRAHVDADLGYLGRIAAMLLSAAKAPTVAASLPSATNSTCVRSRSTKSET